MSWYGKYMGIVRDVADPDGRLRLRAYVPEVMGTLDDTDHWVDWALPCLPWFATKGVGQALVPVVGGNYGVWIEFRHGDVRFPIWCGVFPINSVKPDLTTVELDAGGNFKVVAGTHAEIDAQTTELGGSCTQTPGSSSEAVVLGSGIDTFTGTPYSILGSASSRVFAKK